MSSVAIPLCDRFGGLTRLGMPRVEGTVVDVTGVLVEGQAAGAAVGDLYRIIGRDVDLVAEVVALRGHKALLVPYGALSGIRSGDRMMPWGQASYIAASNELLGRMIDPLGQPIDGLGPAPRGELRPIYADPLPQTERAPVNQRLSLGIRALDAFTPVARGQRLGIFAGPGVGKSVLMGMIARATEADVIVMALVGERGREVGHFAADILGPEGMKKSVLVVATSDRPPSERLRASFVATTLAEYYRDQGKSVLLFVDSLTRFAMAQREIGLAVGEPPTTRGYPPSTFAMMPKLLERVAPSVNGGSVTAFYTVLVEGDDMTDPVGDAARGLLDGHIILSRDLAQRGHFPAVDVLQSLSRVAGDITEAGEQAATRQLRVWLSQIEESRDLVAVGAYKPGADPDLDRALNKRNAIEEFLRQGMTEVSQAQQTMGRVLGLAR